ncbi:FAD-dependent thymidylate synthase [Candidatus Pacearchaeota archaeon]|nr:FAD-dependent thymidylate synthase [Candidatus Pacearchaeota archaeon]
MRMINQVATIEPENPNMVKQIEERGRVCYKSEGKITKDSADKFVTKVIRLAHNSVLEMAVICIDYEIQIASKYLVVGEGKTSGSVRAWREFFSVNCESLVPKNFIEKYPIFFGEFESTKTTFRIIPMPEDSLIHTHVAVRLITNRAVTHEKVRHRPCSFLQESQRYVKYDSPEGIEFIKPVWYDKHTHKERWVWYHQMISAENAYRELRAKGRSPQQARGVLPNDTKTEIIVYCNLKQWNHIFCMRSQGGADPQMIALMLPLLHAFREKWPEQFKTLTRSVG